MVQIRPAVDIDAPAIAGLIASLAHLFLASPDSAGAALFLALTTCAALTAFMTRAEVVYLVSEMNGELCGAFGVVCNQHKPPHLHHLFVVPYFQGRGIGWQLWSARTACGRVRQDCEWVHGKCKFDAIPGYQRFGFETVGTVVQANGLIFQPMQQLLRLSNTADSVN